jgi:DNA phosphorothioation-associated putative methyltransferase
MYSVERFQEIALSCKNSNVGKLLPNALYVHIRALHELVPLLQNYEQLAREIGSSQLQLSLLKQPIQMKAESFEKVEGEHNESNFDLTNNSTSCLLPPETEGLSSASEDKPPASCLLTIDRATLVKFSLDRPKISYLFYADFDSNPHPELQYSVIVDLNKVEVSCRNYQNSDNPPILHRKETFVTKDYFLYEEFVQLTRIEVALGLLNESRYIGTRKEWQLRLLQYNISFEGHYLICPIDSLAKEKRGIRIDRHKAAIVRKELSRPVRLALESNIFTLETSFFDYGCGYGGDLEKIEDRGYTSSGWDPYYRPNAPLVEADIVNLGYIINVIENTGERREALIKAWELTRQVLIVSAQVLVESRHQGLIAYGDGIITNRNTFQKYYQQEELKAYIDRVLDVDAIAVDLGVYFVFRDREKAEAFRVSRVRSRICTPRVRLKVKNFQDYAQLLQPLMNFVVDRGRLPVKGELAEEEAIKEEFRSYKTAFNLIQEATNAQEWEAIAEQRRQDLKLYLALSRFQNRPTVRKLSLQMKEDFKALFGSYKEACLLADRMLFSLGDLKNISNLCRTSSVGKKKKNSLIVHISALENLDPLLRLYESCASLNIGRPEDANIVQINCNKPKISYWFCPDFDNQPHPIIHTSMDVNLRNLQVNYRDFDLDDNPPVLHEKDALVTPDYPLYEKFSRLSDRERDWGLLDDFSSIERLQGWEKCLQEHCAVIKGDRVMWRKDADPYQIKLLKSQIYQRKRQRVYPRDGG